VCKNPASLTLKNILNKPTHLGLFKTPRFFAILASEFFGEQHTYAQVSFILTLFLAVNQGSYRSGKTGKKSGNFCGQGKVREKLFLKSQGK